MPSEDTKLSEFSQHQKFDKASFIVYADLECSTEKVDRYKNNPKKSFTEKMVNILHQFLNVYNIII